MKNSHVGIVCQATSVTVTTAAEPQASARGAVAFMRLMGAHPHFEDSFMASIPSISLRR